MGVYVKGMDMPKHCIDCPLKNDEDDCIVQELQHWKDWNDMKAGCPLVEVPTPHGRLIDADALIDLWHGCEITGDISPIIDARPMVIEQEDE